MNIKFNFNIKMRPVVSVPGDYWNIKLLSIMCLDVHLKHHFELIPKDFERINVFTSRLSPFFLFVLFLFWMASL